MPDPSSQLRPTHRDPLVVVGLLIAGGMLLLAFGIPRDDWITWFTHAIRAERLGRVPDDTIQGVRVLRIAAVLGATTWAVVPFVAARAGRSTDPRASFPAPPISGGGTLAILVAISAAAVVLRIPRLLESLWYDEIAAFIATSIHGPGAALGNYHALANHALHSALVAVSMQAFGDADAELAIRLPAFLAGVATVPAIFVLGRSVEDDRLGLVAAGILAIMPVSILESVESRGYSMMILFAILATHQWLRIADGRRGAIAWYAVMVALGTWSHLVFACVPVGHAVQAAVRGLRRGPTPATPWGWCLALVLGAATTLFVVAPLLPGILLNRTEFVALDGDEPEVFGVEGLHAIWQAGGAWTWWAATPGLLVMLLGLTEARRWPRLGLAVSAGLAGGGVCLIGTLAGGSWLYARFLLFLLPPFALAMAAGIRLPGRFSRRAWPSLATATLVILPWIGDLVTRPPKQPLREAVAAARALAGDGGRAWSIGLGDDVAMFYAEGRGPTLIHAPFLGRDLRPSELDVGPDVAVMLYPDLVETNVLDRLREAGFVEHGRYPGWLDWGRGDVLVWVRRP